jgi:hypothetical protein
MNRQTYTHSSKIELNGRNFVLENSNKIETRTDTLLVSLKVCVWFTQKVVYCLDLTRNLDRNPLDSRAIVET